MQFQSFQMSTLATLPKSKLPISSESEGESKKLPMVFGLSGAFGETL